MENIGIIDKVPFPTNALVSTVLDGLLKQVQNTMDAEIQNAHNSLIDAELFASQQITLAIDNAKNAYKDSLQFTIEKVNQKVLDDLNRIDGMVQEFQQKNAELLKGMSQKVQQFLNTLPFSNLQPQVTTTGPKYIVIGDQPEINLSFDGNFPGSANTALKKPTLSFNGTPLELTNMTTQNMVFRAPVAKLFPSNPSSQTLHTYTVGTLEMPFDNTPNLPWYKRVLGYTDTGVYSFRIMEQALPISPGTVTAVYTMDKQAEPEIKRYVSQEIHEDSTHVYSKGHCGYQDIHHYSFTPEEGYSFVLGTQQIARKIIPGHEPHGNHYEKFLNVATQNLIVEYGGDRCSGKHMGIVTFTVQANQMKPRKTEVITQDQITDLRWGSSKVISINHPDKGRLFKLVFNAFDGSSTEFATGTDLTNKYIQVHNLGDKVQIKAVPPKDFGLTFVKV